jgi:conjugative transfer pilus assembly protein TraH
MNIKYFSTLALATSCLFLSTSLTSPQIAHADMSELYDKAMLNVNSAHIINSGGRNGFSVGGAGFRAELVNPNLLNMTLPSLTAGCGGIDFYGGSFSMINSDQLVQAMRGVMQGSASYVFGLALSSICPTCKELATQLQKKMQQINDMARNACKAANEKLGELNEKDPFFGEGDMILSGGMKDTMAGWSSALGTTDLAWDMYADDTDKVSEKAAQGGKDLSGNVTWKFLAEAEVEGWDHSLGSLDLREVMMSMIGNDFFIPGDPAASPPTEDLYVNEDPILELKAFFGGAKGSSESISYWKCGNKDTGNITLECVQNQLVVETTDDWKGLVQILKDDFSEALNQMKDPTVTDFPDPAKVKLLQYLSVVPNWQKLLVTSDSRVDDLANVLAISASRELIPRVIRKLSSAAHVVQNNPMLSPELRVQASKLNARIQKFDKEVATYLTDFDKDVASMKDMAVIVDFFKDNKLKG